MDLKQYSYHFDVHDGIALIGIRAHNVVNHPGPYPDAPGTHIARVLVPKTILCGDFGLLGALGLQPPNKKTKHICTYYIYMYIHKINTSHDNNRKNKNTTSNNNEAQIGSGYPLIGFGVYAWR